VQHLADPPYLLTLYSYPKLNWKRRSAVDGWATEVCEDPFLKRVAFRFDSSITSNAYGCFVWLIYQAQQ